jgi:hypothetical protein
MEENELKDVNQQEGLRRVKKIKVVTKDGKEFTHELTDMCRWAIKDCKLYNLNTKDFEAVDGDLIDIPHSKRVWVDGVMHNIVEYEKETVIDYTIYQMIETVESGGHIASCDDSPWGRKNLTITHLSKVYEVV